MSSSLRELTNPTPTAEKKVAAWKKKLAASPPVRKDEGKKPKAPEPERIDRALQPGRAEVGDLVWPQFAEHHLIGVVEPG